MAANVASRVLTNGLTVLNTESTHVYICSAEPATYTDASSTMALGNKNWGAGNAMGAPASASPNGQKVSSVAITNGSVTASGTATNWAVVDSVNSRLLATGLLSASQSVTNGNTFALASFDIRLPNQ
jgi:hypothetical protein